MCAKKAYKTPFVENVLDRCICNELSHSLLIYSCAFGLELERESSHIFRTMQQNMQSISEYGLHRWSDCIRSSSDGQRSAYLFIRAISHGGIRRCPLIVVGGELPFVPRLTENFRVRCLNGAQFISVTSEV